MEEETSLKFPRKKKHKRKKKRKATLVNEGLLFLSEDKPPKPCDKYVSPDILYPDISMHMLEACCVMMFQFLLHIPIELFLGPKSKPYS